MGNRFQKLSLLSAFIAKIPLSNPIWLLYKILYFVLKAWEFLDTKLSLLVEQAAKKNKKARKNAYLNILVFNGKQVYYLTFKSVFYYKDW
jgi:hypothetical protein